MAPAALIQGRLLITTLRYIDVNIYLQEVCFSFILHFFLAFSKDADDHRSFVLFFRFIITCIKSKLTPVPQLLDNECLQFLQHYYFLQDLEFHNRET